MREKKNPLEFMNRPAFLIGGAVFAIVSGVMRWIGYEYALICVVAAGVGLFIHYKKRGND
jgi:hypothetical protein